MLDKRKEMERVKENGEKRRMREKYLRRWIRKKGGRKE